MKLEEHMAIIQKLRTETDEATKSNLLLQLENDYKTVDATASENATKIEELEKANSRLTQANNELWLARTVPNTDETKHEEQEHEEHETKLSYDDLVKDMEQESDFKWL